VCAGDLFHHRTRRRPGGVDLGGGVEKAGVEMCCGKVAFLLTRVMLEPTSLDQCFNGDLFADVSITLV